jgi:hypothetical protein
MKKLKNLVNKLKKLVNNKCWRNTKKHANKIVVLGDPIKKVQPKMK